MKNDPWSNINPSATDNRLSGILADKSNILEFYWAKDTFGNLLFVLSAPSEIIPNAKIPKLQGIDIAIGKYGRNNQLIFSLESKEYKDIFYTLCMDLISSTKVLHDEEYAVNTVLYRLDKWQHFLKNRRKIIDKRQLKGLAGELLFLKNYLLVRDSAEAALSFWKAPLQSVHDFEFDNFSVEVKTKSSVNSIYISSYEQLFSELDYLLLYVATLNDSTSRTPKAFNIYTLIDEIKAVISDTVLEERFENLLMQYGFVGLEEYRDYWFLFVSDEFYEVEEDFPRITDLPEGIENLTYRVNLEKCKAFKADIKLLEKAGIRNEYS
ncbi:PD-(D/E)XK motif protein [Sulfurovum riftiae]|uniref:PD-(D/E)XK motif protein n=1 Tax=Sulfurovum riftiae TaxID=1630136 RepID=A0A151CJ31_9BACT|nr:PD-(D/E)XK motif protein [Sulfurovum riftiae]KYJ87548.1 hypothetical protein AS592_10625 [Sulfurovum riftiae]